MSFKKPGELITELHKKVEAVLKNKGGHVKLIQTSQTLFFMLHVLINHLTSHFSSKIERNEWWLETFARPCIFHTMLLICL